MEVPTKGESAKGIQDAEKHLAETECRYRRLLEAAPLALLFSGGAQ